MWEIHTAPRVKAGGLLWTLAPHYSLGRVQSSGQRVPGLPSSLLLHATWDLPEAKPDCQAGPSGFLVKIFFPVQGGRHPYKWRFPCWTEISLTKGQVLPFWSFPCLCHFSILWPKDHILGWPPVPPSQAH